MAPTLATISEALGRPVHGLERREGSVRVTTDEGVASAEGTEIDLGDPLAEGLFRLTEGRLPQERGEVVVNAALADRGPGVGETLSLLNGPTVTVVGIAESTSYWNRPVVAGPLGSLGLSTERGAATWLVDAGGPVTWADVQALNDVGATVLSRAVLENPPTAAQLAQEGLGSTGDDALYAVVALIVVMALIEVVLLAGPAFAVGARKQQHNLALMAASGGTPRQLRRVVLASALVLGGVASAFGVLMGIALAFVVLPLMQRFSGNWLGPFDVPWLHLVGIAAFGLLSAFLAALVPAVIAARQDVVNVLAGRRGDRKPSLRSPLLGLVLLSAGIAGAAYGAVGSSSTGEFYIAASAVVSVLGMILLVPVVLVLLARVSRGLPLPVRYAVRDAARHRTRTVPAVAAVAATVAGVVALGIGAASDELEHQRTYVSALEHGSGAVSTWSDGQRVHWARVEEAIHRALPATDVTAIQRIAGPRQAVVASVDLTFHAPNGPRYLLDGWSSPFGFLVLVSREAVPAGLVELEADQRDAVHEVLTDGGAVVFTSTPVTDDEVRIATTYRAKKGKPIGKQRPVTVPALYLEVPGFQAPLQAVLSPQVVERLELQTATTGLFVDGPISEVAEADIKEAIGAVTPKVWFYVERGYQADGETRIALLVLAALGAVLMLGGTLTATSLALSDARPDLATLSAVGAAPRTRRAVAAAYAGTVGLVGAALGAAVGFIPGIAVTYPLTAVDWTDVDAQGRALPDHFVDIPWLLIGTVVLLLPLLTAFIVGLTSRSRLPLVARID